MSAGSFRGLCVADAMHDGLVTCTPETSLRTVARMLAGYRIHAVLVVPRREADAGHVASWRVISDLDVAQAAADGDVDAGTASEAARGIVRCVQPDEPLASAVTTMLVNGISHVIVVDRPHGRPVGVLSALDVARVLAGSSG